MLNHFKVFRLTFIKNKLLDCLHNDDLNSNDSQLALKLYLLRNDRLTDFNHNSKGTW